MEARNVRPVVSAREDSGEPAVPGPCDAQTRVHGVALRAAVLASSIPTRPELRTSRQLSFVIFFFFLVRRCPPICLLLPQGPFFIRTDPPGKPPGEFRCASRAAEKTNCGARYVLARWFCSVYRARYADKKESKCCKSSLDCPSSFYNSAARTRLYLFFFSTLSLLFFSLFIRVRLSENRTKTVRFIKENWHEGLDRWFTAHQARRSSAAPNRAMWPQMLTALFGSGRRRHTWSLEGIDHSERSVNRALRATFADDLCSNAASARLVLAIIKKRACSIASVLQAVEQTCFYTTSEISDESMRKSELAR